MQHLFSFIRENYKKLILILSLAATLGSLYISETIGIPPCDLCWYQRVFAYPLVIIAALGLFYQENIAKYVLGLAIPGLIIATYHYVIQKFVFAQQLTNCSVNNPCTDVSLNLFGFITIPLLSAGFFLASIVVTLIYQKTGKNS